MDIISKTWCATQNCYLYEYITTEDTSDLPTEGIAYGSSCICGDGKLYFFFPDNSWKAIG